MKSVSHIFPTVLATFFATGTPLIAGSTLLDAFAACEASVVEGSIDPLRKVGSFIDENEHRSRLRVDTPSGNLLAMFIPPSNVVTACILWGREPELAAEFHGLWQDWVEWEEVEVAAAYWFSSALEISGSTDLTDHTQPGYVIARCDNLDHGVVLSIQPAVANVVRQVLPQLENKSETSVHFQFSAIAALPGRCAAAIRAHDVQK